MLNRFFGRKPQAAPIVLPSPAAPPKSATEMLAEALSLLRDELRAEEGRQYKETRDSQQNDERRIAAASAWVEKAGLKDAIPKLVSTMWHYPAWLAVGRERYSGHEELKLFDLSAEKIEGEKVNNGFRVRWRMSEGGPQFSLSFVEEKSWAPSDGSLFADATISVNDDEVLRISLIHDLDKDREYSDWRSVTPSVLQPGEWAAAILELEHRMRTAELQQRAASTAEYKRRQASGLPQA